MSLADMTREQLAELIISAGPHSGRIHFRFGSWTGFEAKEREGRRAYNVRFACGEWVDLEGEWADAFERLVWGERVRSADPAAETAPALPAAAEASPPAPAVR